MRQGVCKNFTGTIEDVCGAGVNYRETVGGEDRGWFIRTPCLLQHDTEVVCNSLEYPTAEEVEKYEEEIKIQTGHLSAAINMIREVGKAAGIIVCPACQNILHFTVSGQNHHIWGQCETEDCLSWMM